MSKWNANREGYADNTASIAIQRVSKEERKNDMAKRSCRRTTDENSLYESDFDKLMNDMEKNGITY